MCVFVPLRQQCRIWPEWTNFKRRSDTENKLGRESARGALLLAPSLPNDSSANGKTTFAVIGRGQQRKRLFYMSISLYRCVRVLAFCLGRLLPKNLYSRFGRNSDRRHTCVRIYITHATYQWITIRLTTAAAPSTTTTATIWQRQMAMENIISALLSCRFCTLFRLFS